MTQLLDEAADALERRLSFDRVDAGYRRVRSDPAAWVEVVAERGLEAGTLRDDLD